MSAMSCSIERRCPAGRRCRSVASRRERLEPAHAARAPRRRPAGSAPTSVTTKIWAVSARPRAHEGHHRREFHERSLSSLPARAVRHALSAGKAQSTWSPLGRRKTHETSLGGHSRRVRRLLEQPVVVGQAVLARTFRTAVLTVPSAYISLRVVVTVIGHLGVALLEANAVVLGRTARSDSLDIAVGLRRGDLVLRRWTGRRRPHRRQPDSSCRKALL